MKDIESFYSIISIKVVTSNPSVLQPWTRLGYETRIFFCNVKKGTILLAVKQCKILKYLLPTNKNVGCMGIKSDKFLALLIKDAVKINQ